MDKIHKPPQLEEVLHGKLYQLTKEFGIAYISYHPATSTAVAQIVIVVIQNKNVEIIESRKWIRNSLQTHGVLFHVFNMYTMEYFYKKGNPFVAYYCDQKFFIYQHSEVFDWLTTDWKSFKKKYLRYTEQFYHDHDILLSESNQMDKFHSDIATVLILKSVYEHDLEYLECLYFGKSYGDNNLSQRVQRISKVLPIIESFFVKENNNEYYLLKEFDKALEDAKQDELYYNDKMLDSIREIETKLYNLISDRFSELKKLIKSNHESNLGLNLNQTKESELSTIISKIIKIKPVEEIYLFDKVQHSKNLTYYFLLVGNGLGTNLLNRIQQSLTSQIDNCTFILIGHSRIWIQKECFIHQAFFQKVMTADNKVYQSHEFHSPLHWESDYTPQYHDISYYFRSAKNSSENFFLLRKNVKRKNKEGLEDLFYQSIMRIFRTYIFSKSTYLPHFLHPFSLWKLCLHFEPNLGKLEFLFEKLSEKDFFDVMNHHLSFHHDHSRISKEKLKIMDEILKLLLDELEISMNSIEPN